MSYKLRISLALTLTILFTNSSYAGNLGFGVHSGYGVLKYKENTSSFGTKVESESKQNVVLFGVSGEYSFPRPKNFYTGIVTDWVSGLKDEERWRENSTQIQTNDMKFFGEFYDLRFGYKNTFDNLYYRVHISGGWDGLHFKRDNFIARGVSRSSVTTQEDFSLWRTGAGFGVGYKLGKWALDGRLMYNYYPKGDVESSLYPGITFDTNGTCFDWGLGISRQITQNMNFYTGLSYTLIKLKEDVKKSGSQVGVFPNSETEMVVGMVNLTYAF